MEFQGFPKMARLRRDMTVTEKIDGTNAAVGVLEDGTVYAQSRTRIITPDADNFGFATWVQANEDTLREDFGVGLHFGEWCGAGIQRKYGLPDKHFVSFAYWETGRPYLTPNVHTVPVLFQGSFSDANVDAVLEDLRSNGSRFAKGFMDPEGIIVTHEASRVKFKVTLKNDEIPKGKI
jgi:hypothetical protein